MATQQVAGAGGTTVSFSNTPQATDDAFYFSEDSTGVLILNVLANDLGGAAKQLYSIDNSISASTATKTPAPSDLLVRDTTYSSTNDSAGLAGTTDKSLLGARIWIASDGTIHYNTADINTLLQSLAQGQVLTDKLTYAIQLGNGTLSWATTTIQFTGTNDAATITASATEDTSVTEAGAGNATTAATPGDATAGGTLTVHDVDAGQAHFAAVAPAALAGTYGNFSFDSATGVWGYTLDNSKAATEALNAGDTQTDTLTVSSLDGTASQTITVTIHGTNDAATITASATGSATEDVTLTAGSTLTVNDVDSGQNHFQTPGSLAGTYGTFTFNATSGVWGYTLANNQANVQALAGGIQVHDTLTVKSFDGTATQTIDVTITGTNDAPFIDLNSGTSGTSTNISYTAGSAATAIAPSATVTDIDSADFNGGKLTVAFTTNGTATDQLTIQNQGTGAGQIGTSGSNVTYGGTIIGTFTGGTNGSNLIITFNASATQAAAAALADHILYSNATSPTATKTVTYTLIDGDGIANGGTDTSAAIATINVTGGGQAPVVDLNGASAGSDATASYPHGVTQLSLTPLATIADADSGNLTSLTVTLTNPQDNSAGGGGVREILSLSGAASAAATAAGLTVTFPSSVANNADPVTLSITGVASVSTYQSILQGVLYSDTKPGSHVPSPARNVDIVASDGANTSIVHHVTISVAAPAGTAGAPINLALTDPSDGQAVTVTVKDVPSGWTIDGATQNADGSWTVQSNAVHQLTVTTPADFTGAAVLDVSMTWTNADGTTGSASIADNVEAYAPGSPIFAWSGNDVLTGSTGNDLFVFSQPIGNDTVHSFDAAADQIDLVGYSGFQSFADVQAHTVDDVHGNAVITLGDGQSITLDGVHSSALGAGNFAFDQTPVVNNTGTMTIGDGALLPLSGTVNNSGTISLDSTGSETLLQVIQHGVTLQGGGQIDLSDSSFNIISGTGPDVTLVNVDNTISGAGQLGDGMLSLDNRGTIIASGTNALVIDTGGSVVANSGTLEATGSGGLVVAGGIANSGMLWANGGNINIHGAVTGEGDATIGNLSKLEFGAASSTDVTFAQNTAGTLELDDSFDFSGRIGGITNDDKLDLNDILFGTGTTVSYQTSQDGSGGTLTVTDGTHGATLHLLGSYDANGFKLADDGQGHTVVTYNPAEFTLTGINGGTSEFAV